MRVNAGSQTKFSRILILFLAILFFNSANISAHDPDENSVVQTNEKDANHNKEDKIDITKIAFEHILDSHYWHFWGEGHDAVALPLPCIIYSSTKGLQFFSSSVFEHGHAEFNGYSLVNEDIISSDPEEKVYDFSITKNVTQLLLSAIFIFWLFTSIAKSYKNTGITNAPKGKQSFFEPLIVFVRDDIAKINIGSKSEKYLPYLLTIFFLILINNVIGMLPFGANLTGNIAFTLVLSAITLLVTSFSGNKHYWAHIFWPPVPKALLWLMIPLEIIGIFTKPFSLMIRLFANMSAGHIIVISLVGLIFIFKTLWVSPVAVAFTLFIDVLECLVAFLQAYIFTMLTSLFIGSAVADHNEDGIHNADDDKAGAQRLN